MKNLLPIVLLTSIISFFLLSFVFGTQAKSLTEKKQQLQAYQDQNKQLPAFQNALATKGDEIAAIEKAFPPKKDIVLIPLSIDTLAASTGVTAAIHFTSETVSTDGKGNTILPVQITVQGKYDAVSVFLKKLENGNYFYKWSSFQGDAPHGIVNENTIILNGNLYIASE